MITKPDFDLVTRSAASNFASLLPKMISFKSYIQKAIIEKGYPL